MQTLALVEVEMVESSNISLGSGPKKLIMIIFSQTKKYSSHLIQTQSHIFIDKKINILLVYFGLYTYNKPTIRK